MALLEAASGAEGRGARKPDDRRLDGRRLVPLRRVPPRQHRLAGRRRPATRARARRRSTGGWDDYDNFREIGSAGAWAKESGYDQLPYLAAHVGATPPMTHSGRARTSSACSPPTRRTCRRCGNRACGTRRTCGARSIAWEALKAKGKLGNNWLVMGPWRHSQVNREGAQPGPFQWNGDTAQQFREEMVMPLFETSICATARPPTCPRRRSTTPATTAGTGSQRMAARLRDAAAPRR